MTDLKRPMRPSNAVIERTPIGMMHYAEALERYADSLEAGRKPIVVPPGGSIQDAVSKASDGDTVIVPPGTYVEEVEDPMSQPEALKTCQCCYYPDRSLIPAGSRDGKHEIMVCDLCSRTVTNTVAWARIQDDFGHPNRENLVMECRIHANYLMNMLEDAIVVTREGR